jgi:hypothetical protein
MLCIIRLSLALNRNPDNLVSVPRVLHLSLEVVSSDMVPLMSPKENFYRIVFFLGITRGSLPLTLLHPDQWGCQWRMGMEVIWG